MSSFSITNQIIGLEDPSAGALTPFTLSKFVAIGASLTNFAFEQGVVQGMCEDIALHKYGLDIDVVEYATGGWDTADQYASMASVLANFTGQSGVVFADHVGGNNISYGTVFNDLTSLQKSDAQDNYQATIDAILAEGHKICPFTLSFRDMGIDNDPEAVKVNELNHSWSYNEDWIIPQIIQANFPEQIKVNGIPDCDQYRWMRSAKDYIFSDADNIHPNNFGQFMFAYYMFLPVLELSQGHHMPDPVEVNYNNSYQNPAETIDVIFAPYTTGGGRGSGSGINWLAAAYGAAPAPGRFQLYMDSGIIQTDGVTPAPSGMTFMYSGATGAYSTTPAGSDTTATLNNTNLRSSTVRAYSSLAKCIAVIEGLEPNRKYTVESVYGDGVLTYVMGANSEPIITPDSGNNGIAKAETVADPFGRMFIYIEETVSGNGSAGISGCRIRSGWGL